MQKKQRQNNRGFALLFSVLLASFLLTIGLSIFSIALKELAISTAARQSVRAFFAADSGRECAIYWDVKEGVVTSKDRTGGEIKCGSGTVNMNSGGSDGPSWESSIPEAGQDNIFVGGPSPAPYFANYRVEIKKTEDSVTSNILTTITARGYDSDSDDRVERAIRQTY